MPPVICQGKTNGRQKSAKARFDIACPEDSQAPLNDHLDSPGGARTTKTMWTAWEAPGRQERTKLDSLRGEAPERHQGGRKGPFGQPGRHQGGTRRQDRTIWTAWEAPERQERTIWTAWEAPGRQERTNWPGRQERTNWIAWEAPGRHQGSRKVLSGQPGRQQGGTRDAGKD